MKIFLLLSLTLLSIPAVADELPQWQFGASSNAVLTFTHFSDGGPDTHEVNVGTHGYYFLNPHWEAGAAFLFETKSTDGSNTSTLFELIPSVIYNFSDLPLSSFFVRGGVGLYANGSASSHSYSALGFVGSVGKRFPITSTVVWSPEFTVSGHTRATDGNYYWRSATEYDVMLFQFSVLF
jgi:hypothetical protein